MQTSTQLSRQTILPDAPDADDLAGSGYDIEEEVEEASL